MAVDGSPLLNKNGARKRAFFFTLTVLMAVVAVVRLTVLHTKSNAKRGAVRINGAGISELFLWWHETPHVDQDVDITLLEDGNGTAFVKMQLNLTRDTNLHRYTKSIAEQPQHVRADQCTVALLDKTPLNFTVRYEGVFTWMDIDFTQRFGPDGMPPGRTELIISYQIEKAVCITDDGKQVMFVSWPAYWYGEGDPRFTSRISMSRYAVENAQVQRSPGEGHRHAKGHAITPLCVRYWASLKDKDCHDDGSSALALSLPDLPTDKLQFDWRAPVVTNEKCPVPESNNFTTWDFLGVVCLVCLCIYGKLFGPADDDDDDNVCGCLSFRSLGGGGGGCGGGD